MRIFEVNNGGWNKERHLQQGACSAYLGIRSNMFSINGPALLSLMALRVRHTQSTSVFSTLERAVHSAIHCRNSAKTQNCLFRTILLSLLDRNVWTQNGPLSVNQFLFLPKPIRMYGMNIFYAEFLAMLSSDAARRTQYVPCTLHYPNEYKCD
jgi:hypothetical protein